MTADEIVNPVTHTRVGSSPPIFSAVTDDDLPQPALGPIGYLDADRGFVPVSSAALKDLLFSPTVTEVGGNEAEADHGCVPAVSRTVNGMDTVGSAGATCRGTDGDSSFASAVHPISSDRFKPTDLSVGGTDADFGFKAAALSALSGIGFSGAAAGSIGDTEIGYGLTPTESTALRHNEVFKHAIDAIGDADCAFTPAGYAAVYDDKPMMPDFDGSAPMPDVVDRLMPSEVVMPDRWSVDTSADPGASATTAIAGKPEAVIGRRAVHMAGEGKQETGPDRESCTDAIAMPAVGAAEVCDPQSEINGAATDTATKAARSPSGQDFDVSITAPTEIAAALSLLNAPTNSLDHSAAAEVSRGLADTPAVSSWYDWTITSARSLYDTATTFVREHQGELLFSAAVGLAVYGAWRYQNRNKESSKVEGSRRGRLRRLRPLQQQHECAEHVQDEWEDDG